MDKREKAKGFYRGGEGFNCAQSLLAAFVQDYGMDEKHARVASVFGGGIARGGGICGAVSGALMVLGLKYGMTDPADQEIKEEAYRAGEEFIAAFARQHGQTNCRDLLGVDPATPEGQAVIREKQLKVTHCARFIESAVELLEQRL